MDDFKGKVAVITGAASGIGRALARRCATEGMNVAIADLQIDGLTALAGELEAQGAKVLPVALNVSDRASMQDFAQRCVSEIGPVTLLFNNAGILQLGQAWTHTVQDWEKTFSVNVMGVANGLSVFVPGMIAAGIPAHIVNTGSAGSLVAAPAMGLYSASKMAVRGITESLAYDFAVAGIKIDLSLLCPGPVATSIGDGLPGAGAESELNKKNLKIMTDNPIITPDECAERVFKAIRENRFWIFTHPFNQHYKQKTDAILNGINPVYGPVEFDQTAE
jgi:NAD(P)-dependent dehydrogenase (short-subunit alcohol dehydrogenase family)